MTRLSIPFLGLLIHIVVSLLFFPVNVLLAFTTGNPTLLLDAIAFDSIFPTSENYMGGYGLREWLDPTAPRSRQEDMAQLARAIYRNDTYIPRGWSLVHHHAVATLFDTDKMEIYQNNLSQCVLVFAGSGHVDDLLSFSAPYESYCGFPWVNSGPAQELDIMVTTEAWQRDFMPYLTSSECDGGITVTGHSLGGAMATLLAACANNGSRPFTFKVGELITWGSPGAALYALYDKESINSGGNGCFNGTRYYIDGPKGYDPLVNSLEGVVKFGSNVSAIHPRLEAKALSAPLLNDQASVVATYDCLSQCARKYPNSKTELGMPFLLGHNFYVMAAHEAFTKSPYVSTPPTQCPLS